MANSHHLEEERQGRRTICRTKARGIRDVQEIHIVGNSAYTRLWVTTNGFSGVEIRSPGCLQELRRALNKHVPPLRHYCTKHGVPVVLPKSGKCPECGLDHRKDSQALRPGTCGHFAYCCDDDAHGHPCDLEMGHTGRHRIARCTST
jgi:hypothetical protein